MSNSGGRQIVCIEDVERMVAGLSPEAAKRVLDAAAEDITREMAALMDRQFEILDRLSELGE